MTGDALLDFVNNRLFTAFKDMEAGPESDPRAVIAHQVFADSYN